MKVFVRTLMILVVALIVAGATYAIAGPGSDASAGGRFSAQAGLGRPGAEQPRGDVAGGEPRGGGGGGLFGAVEVLRNLALIGVIVAVVAPIKRLLAKRSRVGAPRRAALDKPAPEQT
jgi:hypothetical protein